MNMAPNPDPVARTVEGLHGLTLNVWDHGGEGRPLLFAHPTGTHGRSWDPIIKGLKGAFRSIAIDARGHGDSDTPEDPEMYDWKYPGLEILAVIDALELETPLFAVGHSAGAAQICYAELERPGTFSRAILIDPIIAPAIAFQGPNPLAKVAKRRINIFESRAAARERYASKPPLAHWDEDMLSAYVDHAFDDRDDGKVELKCPGHIEAAMYERGGAADVFERLDELEFEAMLVTADGSDVRGLALLQKEHIPKVHFREITGSGHFIPQERPEEVISLISEWFG